MRTEVNHEEIRQAVLKYKDQFIQDLQNLIGIRSVRGKAEEGMPAGRESFAALKYMLDRSAELGFPTTNVDGYMGYASYGEGDDYIAVIGHLDVVPEGEGWVHDPFGGEVEDGKIYGRGAVDNKGASVAALYSLKVLKDLGYEGTKEVRAMYGTMEETGMEDIIHYLSKNPEPVMALVPDATYPIYNKQRGVYAFQVSFPLKDSAIVTALGGEQMNAVPGESLCTIDGTGLDFDQLTAVARNIEATNAKASIELERAGQHINIKAIGVRGSSSYGHIAMNANLVLMDFLVKALGERAGQAIIDIQHLFKLETDGKSLGLHYVDEEYGVISVGLCKIDITDGVCKLLIDIRFPSDQKLADVKAHIAQVFANYEVSLIREYEAHYVPEDSEICTILSKVYEEATNDKTRYVCNYGMNYSRFITNGVAFGNVFPWDRPGPSHGPDEFIEIDSLMEHCAIHVMALIEMMK